ncbi:unnamed protein product [Rangifer tarandus platyrhynchus]|uniref:Uncharacterized protein n=1 Tax=Rangifer tarandus platyrhynchus TaxID=3082113 RepID=A0AC59Z7S1_RANTA
MKISVPVPPRLSDAPACRPGLTHLPPHRLPSCRSSSLQEGAPQSGMPQQDAGFSQAAGSPSCTFQEAHQFSLQRMDLRGKQAFSVKEKIRLRPKEMFAVSNYMRREMGSPAQVLAS